MHEKLIERLEKRADSLYGYEDGVIDRDLMSEAAYAISTLTVENAALKADLARVTAALDEMRFAYINKDGDCPHSFELEALQLAEDILGAIGRSHKEVEVADAEGRFVALPVPRGTTIYRVLHYGEHKCQGQMKGRVVAGSTRIRKGVMQWEDAAQWGKTVFLTREAAKAAMEGRDENS